MTDNAAASIGARIREEREWCHFSHALVAHALGITEAEVVAFEDGTSVPDTEKIEKLNLLLGLAPGRLHGEPLPEELPPDVIACGPRPVTRNDRLQLARFAEFLQYSHRARKEASNG